MFTLSLLGGATIAGPDGPLSGRIAQRRQLALLAYLAVQGDRPTSRDKLLAVLWPESAAERARHNLADAVYLIRKTLGDESVLTVGDDLVLSRDRVESDVARFQGLLESGDLEPAVQAYAGPFLDGFHLPGSRAFEDWLGAERERLARACTAALETLAREADGAGHRRRAVEWWQRAVAAEPHNSRFALHLMRALAAAGDRAAAVRWADTHGALLEDELGLEPDPAVVTLAARLRDPAAPSGVDPAPADPAAAGSAPHDPHPDDPALDAADTADTPVSVPVRRPRRARSIGLAGLGAGIGLALLVAALASGPDDDGPAGSPAPGTLDPEAVVVVPFRTAGASPEVAYLGQGMVELLAAKLGGDGGLRAVDPGVVVAAWRDAVGESGDVTSRERALALARSKLAGQLMVGGVVGTRSALALHASVVDTNSGDVVAEATVHGTEEVLQDLVDRLVAQLLVRHAGEEEHRVAYLTSASPAALRTFLHGRAAHRRGSYEEALRLYGRALDLDSTFALAGLGVTQVAGWVGGSRPQAARASRVVSQNLDRLSERDRVGLLGRVAPRDPARLPSVVERLEAVEEALRRWPDHARLWYRRGDDLMHFGLALELPSWETRARESFERAMALDPDFAEPVHHLAVILTVTEDTVALRQLVEQQLARSPTGPVADYLRWWAHHVLDDADAFRPPSLEAMDTDATLRWIGIVAQDYGFALDDGRAAVRLRLDRPGIRDQHFERRHGAFAYALNRGRPAEALSILDTLRDVQPDPHFHLRIGILTALYGDGDRDAAARAARALAEAPLDGELGELNRCVADQWRIASEGADGRPPPDLVLPPAPSAADPGSFAARRAICSAVVRAQHAALADQPAGAATARLDSLLTMGRYGGLVDDGHTEFAHVALARLHLAAGNPEAALRALRRRAHYQGWQPYLVTMLREEGHLAAGVGDFAGAIRAYQHYLALRDDPEPTLRAEVEQVRAELRALRDGP
jgi:DNA-binding SARP family transcriptional activator